MGGGRGRPEGVRQDSAVLDRVQRSLDDDLQRLSAPAGILQRCQHGRVGGDAETLAGTQCNLTAGWKLP